MKNDKKLRDQCGSILFNSPLSKKQKTKTSNTTNGMDRRRVSEFRIILIFIEKCQMTDTTDV